MTLLDSNILIHCLKGREPAAIPRIVAYELEYGTLKVEGPRRRRLLSHMLDGLEEVPFDRAAAREAARIRLELGRHGDTLATNNTR